MNAEQQVVKEPEAEEIVISYLPSQNNGSQQGKSILLLARHPGAANCLSPLGHLLRDKGASLYLAAAGVGEARFQANFPDKAVVAELPREISWVLCSNDDDQNDPTDSKVNWISQVKASSSLACIGIVEDFPGTLHPILNKLLERGIVPDLVLTTTRSAARTYYKAYPQLAEKLVVPIGQPSFDEILKEDTLEVAAKAREKLHIPQSALVVSYIGIPSGDYPHVPNAPGEYQDLNSVTLRSVLAALINIAVKHPNDELYFVFRPHPREKSELWKHPLLSQLKDQAANLHELAFSEKEWDSLGMSARQLSAASNLVITTFSTVGQQVGLSGARAANATTFGSLPLHILLPGSPAEYRHPGGLLVVDIGATAVATDAADVENEMEKCLYSREFQRGIQQAQQTRLQPEYRFKAPSTSRAYHWLRVVTRYGDNALGFVRALSQHIDERG